MSQNRYQWLLFDLDNTLIDFNEASHAALKALTAYFGVPFTEAIYKEYEAANSEAWHLFELHEISALELRKMRFSKFFEHVGIEEDPLKGNSIYIENVVQHTKMLPGADALLDDLKSNHKIAIVTNGLKEAQRPRIELTGLKKWVDAIFVSDEMGVAKPHPNYYHQVTSGIDFYEKSSMIAIGDSLKSDILGANTYQIDSLWFNPNHIQNTTIISPTFEAKDFNEIKSLIKH